MKQLKPLTVYGFTIFFNAAVSFGTFSILTHYLSEVDYGIINLYNSFIILLMPFISIGVPFVLNVDYFKMKERVFNNQFLNAISIPATACLIFSILFLFLHLYIERFAKVNFFFAVSAPFLCLLLSAASIKVNISKVCSAVTGGLPV